MDNSSSSVSPTSSLHPQNFLRFIVINFARRSGRFMEIGFNGPKADTLLIYVDNKIITGSSVTAANELPHIFGPTLFLRIWI